MNGRFLTIRSYTRGTLLDHLEEHVRPHLSPDVSNYAKGRMRAWLEIEAPLGPTQPFRQGLHSDFLWSWMRSLWQQCTNTRSVPDLGLCIHGDVGIKWHRDASYAQPQAVIVNLGPCRFEMDTERQSAPGQVVDPIYWELQGSEAFAFDCKHQHRVLEPDPERWSIVLWRLKPHLKRLANIPPRQVGQEAP